MKISDPDQSEEPWSYFSPGEKSIKIFFFEPDFTATLYDLKGQMISNLNSKSGSIIYCNACSSGIYMLRISTNERSFVKKVVISD